MLERFQREFNDPMKEIRSMESEIGSLNPEMIKNNWFKEEVEVKDDDIESYADIKIPDFKDGRQGRFIHDYKNNLTTIVDESAKRCFIYPLDYETTLPPKSMADVFFKMQTGYCKLVFTPSKQFTKSFLFFRFPGHKRTSQEDARCSPRFER